jgi:hypothetical protein
MLDPTQLPFSDEAGGFCEDVAIGEFEQETRGATCLKANAGQWSIVTDEAIPMGTCRMWCQVNEGASPLSVAQIYQGDETHFFIEAFVLSIDTGGEVDTLIGTHSDMELSWGIDRIPRTS